jgi:hypothetical protein
LHAVPRVVWRFARSDSRIGLHSDAAGRAGPEQTRSLRLGAGLQRILRRGSFWLFCFRSLGRRRCTAVNVRHRCRWRTSASTTSTHACTHARTHHARMQSHRRSVRAGRTHARMHRRARTHARADSQGRVSTRGTRATSRLTKGRLAALHHDDALLQTGGSRLLTRAISLAGRKGCAALKAAQTSGAIRSRSRRAGIGWS